jgi:hypothetical protein
MRTVVVPAIVFRPCEIAAPGTFGAKIHHVAGGGFAEDDQLKQPITERGRLGTADAAEVSTESVHGALLLDFSGG